MSCAVFLILVESSHMIASEYPKEKDATWRWGAAVLGGFLTPLVFFLFEPSKLWSPGVDTPEGTKVPSGEAEMTGVVAVRAAESSLDGDDEVATPVATEVAASETANKRMTTVFAICAGDFAHNLTDGFAIGISFKHCDLSLAWGILGATLYHEIAQELADFVLLTSDAGCTVTQALLFNFVAGTSVILGGLIGHGVDVGQGAMGVILAFGGGTYVYLAASEALPLALNGAGSYATAAETKKHYAAVIGWFILGAIAVGIILEWHEHCGEEGDDDEGGGHHRFRF